MDRKQFTEYLEDFFKKGLDLVRAKNMDYASEGDPFRNFNLAQTMGVTDSKTALMVRMCDKVSRIATLLKQERTVQDETIHDTLQDLSNYAAILSAMISNEKP